jgi:hypothetical protein
MRQSERPTSATLRPWAAPAAAADCSRATCESLIELVVVAADQLDQGFAHVGLGSGLAGPQRIGRIADQGVDTLLAQPGQRREVRGLADQRVRVELPVAGMQHGAGRGPDHQRVRLRDRMGQRDQLDVERPDVEPAAERLLDDLDRMEQAGLRELQAQDRGGERRRVDRAAEPRPQMADRADMVLMRVGDDEAGQVGLALGGEARIGHDDLDPRHGLVRKRDAQIDHQPFAGIAVEVEVHADLAGAAQGQEHQLIGFIEGRRGCRSHGFERNGSSCHITEF